jgi:hypothetical protein
MAPVDGLMLFFVQKGTYVDNLTEVVLRDWNHLKGLISVCEGANMDYLLRLYIICSCQLSVI